MIVLRRGYAAIFSLVCLAAAAPGVPASAEPPAAAARLEARVMEARMMEARMMEARMLEAGMLEAGMREWIDFFDSPAYATAVSWDEHVVLAYRALHGRPPAPLELFLAAAWRDDLGASRSDVVALAARDLGPELGWPDVRRFLETADRRDFRPDAGVREEARRLAATPWPQVVAELDERIAARRRPRGPLRPPVPAEPTPAEAGEEYLTLFGDLHAHSELSDGVGTANEAYRHARDEAGLDYFGLTDHGELLRLWPWENKWERLRDAADLHDEPGRFTALWGFEWSNPVLGHINAINSADYTDSVSDIDLGDIYRWIGDRPRVIGRFNHPGRYDDLFLEFDHLDHDPEGVNRMVGIETFNKDDGFGRFHYDCIWLFCERTYLDEGNRNGWFLGALGGQDNHSADWGTRNDFRTAVLARQHSRNGVLEAYARRRFYSTEDSDLRLDVRVAGFPMGSRLTAVPRLIEVSAVDDGGDSFAEVRLYRNGDVIASQAVAGPSIEVTFDDSARSGDDYYVVIVTQSDDGDGDGRGDEAIASPIWISD